MLSADCTDVSSLFQLWAIASFIVAPALNLLLAFVFYLIIGEGDRA